MSNVHMLISTYLPCFRRNNVCQMAAACLSQHGRAPSWLLQLPHQKLQPNAQPARQKESRHGGERFLSIYYNLSPSVAFAIAYNFCESVLGHVQYVGMLYTKYSALLCSFAAHVAPELAPLGTSRQAPLVGGQAYVEQGPLAAFQGTLPGAWCCLQEPSRATL